MEQATDIIPVQPSSTKKIVLAAIITFLFASAVFGGLFYWQYQKLTRANSNLSQVNNGLSEANNSLSERIVELKEKEVDLLERVSKLEKQTRVEELVVLEKKSPEGKYKVEVVGGSDELEGDVPVELVLEDLVSGEQVVVYKSELINDTEIWTSIESFEFKGSNSEYLEYRVKKGISSWMLIYDIVRKETLPVLQTGFVDKSFVYNDYYVICSASALDGWGASVVAAKAPEWERYFIYPQEANVSDPEKKEEIVMKIHNNEFYSVKDCKLEGDLLTYTVVEGKNNIKQSFNLSTLK